MHRKPLYALMISTTIGASLFAETSAPPADAEAAMATLQRACDALSASDSLLVKAHYAWTNTGLLAGGEGAFAVTAKMARGGKFFAVLHEGNRRIAGICSDGINFVEWSDGQETWTRYPVSQRTDGFRLLRNIAGQPPIVPALVHFDASWIDEPSQFINQASFEQSLREASKIKIEDDRCGDVPCRTVSLTANQRNGTMKAKMEASFGISENTGMPMFVRTWSRLSRTLIALGESTTDLEFKDVAVNASITPETFTFAAPADWTFVEPNALQSGAELLVGQSAADWRFQTLDGGEFAIAERCDDGPVLVVLWATWCAPCKIELKELTEWKAAGTIPKQLQILAVSGDNNVEVVHSFVKRNPLRFTVAHDAAFSTQHQLNFPTSILIDRQGKIARTWTGGLPKNELMAALDDLQPPSGAKP